MQAIEPAKTRSDRIPDADQAKTMVGLVCCAPHYDTVGGLNSNRGIFLPNQSHLPAGRVVSVAPSGNKILVLGCWVRKKRNQKLMNYPAASGRGIQPREIEPPGKCRAH